MKLEWTAYPGVKGLQAPLSSSGHYVISHRPGEHNVSYRPPGQHVHVGTGKTKAEAKRLAEAHAQARFEKRSKASSKGYREGQTRRLKEVLELFGL
jgi:hypothetical protein